MDREEITRLYDPNKDPTGEVGLRLADALYTEEIYRRLIEDESVARGGQRNTYHRNLFGEEDPREYWARVSLVALPRFSELNRGERIRVREVKRRLGQIRKAGHPVGPYSHMNAEDAWKYLSMVRSDIARKARRYCPDVLEEITRVNNERRRSARGELR